MKRDPCYKSIAQIEWIQVDMIANLLYSTSSRVSCQIN